MGMGMGMGMMLLLPLKWREVAQLPSTLHGKKRAHQK